MAVLMRHEFSLAEQEADQVLPRNPSATTTLSLTHLVYGAHLPNHLVQLLFCKLYHRLLPQRCEPRVPPPQVSTTDCQPFGATFGVAEERKPSAATGWRHNLLAASQARTGHPRTV